jgi:signal transduction histidine kinase
MSQIVDDLLLLSKVDSGELRLNKGDINLTEILNEVVSQMNILAHSRKNPTVGLYSTTRKQRRDPNVKTSKN